MLVQFVNYRNQTNMKVVDIEREATLLSTSCVLHITNALILNVALVYKHDQTCLSSSFQATYLSFSYGVLEAKNDTTEGSFCVIYYPNITTYPTEKSESVCEWIFYLFYCISQFNLLILFLFAGIWTCSWFVIVGWLYRDTPKCRTNFRSNCDNK